MGQYQHDLKEAELNEALSGVVEDCVNAVGVDVNTASPSLLSHVLPVSTPRWPEKHRDLPGRKMALSPPGHP